MFPAPIAIGECKFGSPPARRGRPDGGREERSRAAEGHAQQRLQDRALRPPGADHAAQGTFVRIYNETLGPANAKSLNGFV